MNNTVNVELDIYQILYTPNRNYISLKDTNLVKTASGFSVTYTPFWVSAIPYTKDVMWENHLTLNLFSPGKDHRNNSYLIGLLWELNTINIESILIW